MLKKYFTESEYENIKNSDNLLFKSLEIVNRVFKDSVDKGGMPYSIHLLRVYGGVFDYNEKIVALLHDILEDIDISKDDLIDVGIPNDIIDMVLCLTKLKGEDYNLYIERIINSGNIHVLNVKLADLSHNMEIKRIKNPTVNDYERINKRYLPAREKILKAIEEWSD